MKAIFLVLACLFILSVNESNATIQSSNSLTLKKNYKTFDDPNGDIRYEYVYKNGVLWVLVYQGDALISEYEWEE